MPCGAAPIIVLSRMSKTVFVEARDDLVDASLEVLRWYETRLRPKLVDAMHRGIAEAGDVLALDRNVHELVGRDERFEAPLD
jgi:hypothetical protein